jgi:hypothetical protein
MSGSDFETARLEHRSAVTSYLEAARRVADDRWNEPVKPGAWSAGQISEHLRLSYAVFGGELRGKTGLRIRTSWWMRLILRFRYLPRILSEGRIPQGAKAPREVRPDGGPFPRAETLAALEREAAECEAAIRERWDQPTAFATHHVFGKLTPDQALRFATVHIRHHAAQLGA